MLVLFAQPLALRTRTRPATTTRRSLHSRHKALCECGEKEGAAEDWVVKEASRQAIKQEARSSVVCGRMLLAHFKQQFVRPLSKQDRPGRAVWHTRPGLRCSKCLVGACAYVYNNKANA